MKKIFESSVLEKKGNSWEVLIITAGQGSSGHYTPEVLKEYGAIAWPSGTQIFNDHLTESDYYERKGNHSINDLVGVTTSDPVWAEEEQGLRAKIKVFTKHSEFINEAFEHIGLSVEANAYVSDEGVVEQIAPSPMNAIAVVPRAGRGGKFKELQEKYVEPDIVKNDKDQGVTVTDEQIQKIVEGITAGLKPSLDAIQESLTPVVEEPKNDEEVDLSEVTESAIEAGLPKTARNRVVKAVREGATAEDAIAAEKALKEEYTALAEAEAEGRLQESGNGKVTMDEIFGGNK